MLGPDFLVAPVTAQGARAPVTAQVARARAVVSRRRHSRGPRAVVFGATYHSQNDRLMAVRREARKTRVGLNPISTSAFEAIESLLEDLLEDIERNSLSHRLRGGGGGGGGGGARCRTDVHAGKVSAAAVLHGKKGPTKPCHLSLVAVHASGDGCPRSGEKTPAVSSARRAAIAATTAGCAAARLTYSDGSSKTLKRHVGAASVPQSKSLFVHGCAAVVSLG